MLAMLCATAPSFVCLMDRFGVRAHFYRCVYATQVMQHKDSKLNELILSTEGYTQKGLAPFAAAVRVSGLKELRLMKAGLSPETMSLFSGDGCTFLFV